MLPPGYITRYARTSQGISIHIQSPTSSQVTAYYFNNSKHGQESLRRYLDFITRKYIKNTFSKKMTNVEIIEALIFAFRMRGLIK